MKNYKDYPKQFIGESDIASLTLRSPGRLEFLNFGEDGDYRAYIVDENAKIGEHYELELEFSEWLTIYDDTELTFKARAEKINVYRAGDFGCIIQLINKEN